MRDRLCKMLGIDIPIVLAPMGGAVGPPLAAAVSNAGALGTLPLWRSRIDTLRSGVRKTRALKVQPAAEIVREMNDEANAILRRLGEGCAADQGLAREDGKLLEM
jgi:NAD(P)H-dependent flavin oxidoreductase YrpB (nitropropane dioxygenase family)